MIRVSGEFIDICKSHQKEGENLEQTIRRILIAKSNVPNHSSEIITNQKSPFALYQSEEEMNAHGFLTKDIIDIDLTKNRIILEKNGGGTWFYSFKKGEILDTTLDLMKQRKNDKSWNDVLAQACFKRGEGKQLTLVEIRV